MRIGKYAVIGLALDVFDWIGIGMIPVLCDIVDVGAALFWMSRLGPLGLIELLEVIPAGDVLPTNLALGMMVDAKLARLQPEAE